jgi:capsular polysaccharide biosynthesis protein
MHEGDHFMELRQYWQIVRRRLWIVVVLLALVLVIHLLMRPAPAVAYQASMRFMMGVEPEAKTGDYYTYDKYYTWLTAEYLIDDTAALVRSQAFAEAVSSHLAGVGVTVPAGTIQGSTQAGQLHRVLSVHIVWGDATELGQIAQAVAAVLPDQIARHFAQIGTQSVNASLIDPPVVGEIGPSLKQKLDLPVRLALALVAGVALAFALDYLDTTVHSRQEVEQSGLDVLAEIPPPRSRSSWGLWRRLP